MNPRHGASSTFDDRRLADLLRPWHSTGADGVEHYAAIGPGELRRLGNDQTAPKPAVAIAVVARRHRIGLARRLRRAGFQPEASVLLVPRWPRSEHLLTIGASLPDGVERHLGSGRPMSILGWLGTRPLGRRIVALVAPSVGTIATTGQGTPTSVWFAPEVGRPVDLHVSARPRVDAPTQLVLAYRRGVPSPTVAVKFSSSAAGVARLEAERRGLTEIGRQAATSDLAVPQIVDAAPGHLALSVLPGLPLDRLLRDRPGDLERLTSPVLSILERWQLDTKVPRLLTELPTTSLAEQLAAVTAVHPNLVGYAAAIEMLVESVSDGPVPAVVRHGDLTVANVFRAEADGTTGFLDWESAKSQSLPTTDDWYFAADALAVTQSCSHADAVELLVRKNDGPARFLVEHVVHTQSSLDLPDAVATLAFHATWIDHAYDDVVRGTAAARFVSVLQRLDRLAVGSRVTMVPSP